VPAQGEQPLLRADRRGGIRPARPAHRAQQDGIRVLAGTQRAIGQGRAGRVNGATAHQCFLEVKSVAADVGNALQYALRRSDDFGADAITGEDGDCGSHT